MKMCNMCGKPFDTWDLQEDFSVDHMVGYGSKFDESHVSFDLCCECFDKVMEEYIIPNCKYSPIVGDE